MAQQTAVEWLIEQLEQQVYIIDHKDNRVIPKSFDDIIQIKKQAKEMEKEQIINAFSDGQETPLNHPTLPHYSREEYYNDTYSKRQDSPDTDDIK